MGAKSGTNEQQLRTAIVAARGLTTTDRWLFTVLTTTADWGTGFLPDRFAPRSLRDLAAKCQVSERQANYSVSHLQKHGWLERHRNITDKGIGGRGHPTRYVLLMGRDCDCPPKGARGKDCNGCTVPGCKDCTDCSGNYARAGAVPAGQVPGSAGRARGRGEKEGERLTIEIAGETYDAIRCGGCSAPVPVKFAVDGCHPGCSAG